MRKIWLGVVLLAGCFRTASGKTETVNDEDRLRSLAMFQLNCPRAELRVLDMGSGEMAGVSGCGQRETYVYVDDRWHRSGEAPTVVEEGRGWGRRRRR